MNGLFEHSIAKLSKNGANAIFRIEAFILKDCIAEMLQS
jgi:hypothetical protein